MASAIKLPAIFTAIDKFSGPVSKMSKTAESSMARMDRKFRKVGDAAFSVSKKSAMLATGIIAPLALVANESVKFEKSMANVSTLIDTNVESMDAMGSSVLDIATRLPVPIEELTASLFDIRSAGIGAKDAMAVLESSSKLAVAGLGTVEEATDITTSAMNAFASEGKTAAQITDILFKTSKAGKTTISDLATGFGATAPIIQSAGVELADFAAATAALTTLGTPATQAQNQLRAAIISIKKPTTEMQKVFKALGVTSDQELIKKFGNMGAAFDAVNGKIAEMGLNSAQTIGSTEALAGITSLTGATNKVYTETLDGMINGTNQLDDAFRKQSETGASGMQLMQNNIKALSIGLGNAVIPLINEMVAVVSPMLKSFSDWAKNNKETVSTIIKVAAVVGGLAAAISVISFVVGVASKAMAIFSAVQKAIAIGTKVVTAVQWLWNAALLANPIGAIIVAVAALAAGVYLLARAFTSQSKEQELANGTMRAALDASVEQRAEVTLLFKQLRKAKVGTEEYATTLAKIEAMQPGITAKFNLQTGAIKNQIAAEKALKSSILDRALAEASAEQIKEKTKEALTALNRENTMTESILLKTGAVSQQDINKLKAIEAQSKFNEADILAQQQADRESKKDVNPKTTQQEITSKTEKKTTESVEITLNGFPDGTTVKGGGKGNASKPKLGTTR